MVAPAALLLLGGARLAASAEPTKVDPASFYWHMEGAGTSEAGAGFSNDGCSLCKDSDAKLCYDTAEDFCNAFEKPRYLKLGANNKTMEFQPYMNMGCEGSCREKCVKAQEALSKSSKKEAVEKCKAALV